MTLQRPESIDAALALLAEGGGTILAGGTDVYPALRDATPPECMIDVTGIEGLRDITLRDGIWRLGAATTWTDIVRADLPQLFTGLKLAAREVGSVQIQNTGTLAGNICNASPAADGVPALMSLDTQVEIMGPEGRRAVMLQDFIKGPRAVDLGAGEMITALLIPDRAGQGAFLKLGSRRYLVISIAMVSAVIKSDDGVISRAAISVGACSPVAFRATALEEALVGADAAAVAGLVQAADLPDLTPITDVRASASYRQDAVRTLVTRTIHQAMEPPHVAG